MVNGKWKMENQMVNGKWQMENQMVNCKLKIVKILLTSFHHVGSSSRIKTRRDYFFADP